MITLATIESLLGSIFFAGLVGCLSFAAGVGLLAYAQRRGWVKPPT